MSHTQHIHTCATASRPPVRDISSEGCLGLSQRQNLTLRQTFINKAPLLYIGMLGNLGLGPPNAECFPRRETRAGRGMGSRVLSTPRPPQPSPPFPPAAVLPRISPVSSRWGIAGPKNPALARWHLCLETVSFISRMTDFQAQIRLKAGVAPVVSVQPHLLTLQGKCQTIYCYLKFIAFLVLHPQTAFVQKFLLNPSMLTG